MENEEPDPRVGLKAAGAADGTQMRVGNLVCPMAFVNVFTPMEFEEIVHLFNKYDDDRSGELDINELRKLMLESDMEYDDENVRLMLEELDEDKSGLIDFEEFCAFLARVKAGDSKLQGFVGMTEMLNTTSVGILQEQCVKRNLMVSYVIIEEHNPTAISPHKHYVMEVRLEGEWVEPSSDKGVVRSVDVRRFQGIGKSTREGRMAAAEAALRKLRSLMPGIEVEHGQLPDDWKRWLKDNAKQGVDLNRLLAELRAKGFAPFANPEVMHWALATGSLDRLIETHPAGSPTVDDARDLRPEWRAWVDRCLSIGLDGAVIVEVIQERGVSTLRMEAYAQRLRRGDGAKGANPVYPRLLDFWQCCESGLLFEVELYLSAGQPPDAPALHPPRGAISLPLSLAAARGHCEVVDALASRNVDVEATDLMGRTALHHAAKHGQVEACRRLLEYNATLNAKDTVGCTPLHMAARYNSAQCCELLAFHGEETVRQVVSDRIPVANKPVTKIMTDAFHHLIKQRLRSNETHRFRKEWIHDAVIWCRNQLHPSKQSLLQEPSRELVDYVVGRFDPDPDAGFWQLNAGSFPTFVPSVAEPWHLAEIFRHIFRLAVCGSRDDRGWSALYQACMENRVCSHEETIRVLVEFHQFNLFQTDRNGKMAVELLFDFEGGRPNTPSGSREKEGLLMDKRKDILAEDRRQQDLEDGERKERGRVETLLKTRSKAVDMDPELWRATQEASLHLRTLGGWMEYVDPETLNRFFYRNELVLKKEPEGGKGGDGGKTKRGPLARLTSGQGQDKGASSRPLPGDTTAHAPAHGVSDERKNAAKSKGVKQTGSADEDEEMVEEESIDHFQWETPEEFAREEAVLLGWASVINDSEFIRTHSGRYNSVLNKRTGVFFYVDSSNEACLLTVPQQATLMWAFEHSEGTGRVLGQHREWEVRVDQDGNEFYCLENVQRVRRGRVMEEILTRDLRWDRPVEAIPPVDLTAGNYALCTMDVAGYERAEQPWYICQECDEEWKGDMQMFRVCVACARNCHKGRLGHRTRFCKLSNTRCMCCERGEGSCLYFNKKEEVVASSLEKRCTAKDEKAYLDQEGKMEGISPPGLAYVPDEWPDGRPKDVCGWQICRKNCDIKPISGWTAYHDPELPKRLPLGAEVRPRCARDARVEVTRSSGREGARRARDALITKGLFFWKAGHVEHALSDDWYVVRIHGRAAEEEDTTDESSKPLPLDWEFQKDRLCMTGTAVFYYHAERRECTWDPPLEIRQGNPQWAKTHVHESPEEPAASPSPEKPGRSVTVAADDEKPKDREKAGDGESKDREKTKDREKAGDGESKDKENIKGREKAGGGESKDREKIAEDKTKDVGEEANGNVPGMKGGSDGAAGRELAVIPDTAGVASSSMRSFPGAGGVFDDFLGGLSSKHPKIFECGYPPLCLDEWEGLQKAARVVCIRGRYTTYLDRETSSLFYHDEVMAARDKLALMMQRVWRRRTQRRSDSKATRPVRLRTGAFSFQAPEELAARMKLCTAWAYLRRGARLVRELKDKDDDRWEEYQDRTTGLYFYCCPALMKSSFHPPDLPPPSAEDCNSKSRLKEGDVVAFKFRGDSSPSTAEVVRVRETRTKTDAGDTLVTIHYDVKEHETAAATPGPGSNAPQRIPNAGALTLGGGKGLEKNQTGGLRTERWVKRQQLTRAPKTAEEIALDDKEAAWKHELTLAKARRKKDLSKKAEEIYRAERLRKRGPSGVMIGRRERGRTEVQAAERSKKRAATEKALRDDDARVALIEAQKASQELLAAKARLANKDSKKNRRRPDKRQPPASPAPEALTSSHHQAQDRAKTASADTRGDSVIIPALANADKGVKDGWVVSAGGGLGGDIDGMEEPHRRGADEDRLAIRARALRESLKKREDKMTTPRTVNRRRLIRMVHMAMVRQADGFVVCEWGCRAWVRRGQEKFFHETEQCSKRILPCELGCGLRMREEEWLSPSLADPSVPCQQHHEEIECPRRLVPCSQRCGEWLPFEDLAQHVKVYCVKRPFPPVKCRLGCGEEFHGGLHRMLQSEEERVDHEHELCQHRLLHCVWEECEEMVMAKDRRRHREEHVIKTGVFLFTVPGKFNYKVPPGCRHLKVQAWGAGGGSGHFSGGQCGSGGGGAFAEAILYVTPEEELEITVGSGGSAGVYGAEVEVPGGVDQFGKPVFDIVDQHGVAEGGWPGGGAGHGGNPHWAAGGGGGCSMVAKKISSYGGGRSEPLVVAGAGGGGGSRAGVPGGGLDGEIPGTKMDMRNGRMGTASSGGEAGDSGDINGCTFPPEHGRATQ